MSEKGRSYWSTTAGAITGLASVATAVVGLLTVAVNLGWLNSKDSSKTAATSSSTTETSSIGGTSTTFGRGGTSATTSAGSSLTPLQATPDQLTFDSLGSRDQQVTIRNASSTSLTLQRPTISGVDAGEFTATDLTCGARLDANRTCEIRVTYRASRTGTSTAALVVKPDGPPALEVPLRGSRLI